MAENLMGFASTVGPYVHSKPYNFRNNVGLSLSQSKTLGLRDITETIKKLQSMENSLRTEAMSFLEPWGGDYRLASKELFLGGDQNSFEQNKAAYFRRKAIDVINTKKFVQMIIDSKQFDTKQVEKILKKYGETNFKTISKDASIEDIVDEIVNRVFSNPKANVRIDLTGDKKKIIRHFLGDMERKYARDRASLVKQLTEGLKKKATTVNTTKVYKYFEKEFLAKFTDEKEREEAKGFLSVIKKNFIARLKAMENLDYSNVTGDIGESLILSIIGNNEMQLSFLEVGGKTEDELLVEANKLAQSLQIPPNQLAKNLKTPSAVKSGTDWAITNGKGKMVRAQVKNSAIIAEELREKGKTSFPQTVKIQDSIYYKTLKYNLQTYSKDSNLSDTDWANLEYLMANVLWIRAHGSVSTDKGGDYRSGVSGIMLLINQILSKEIGYFLGVAVDAIGKSTTTVIGASNIFFVLDGTILYPTYKIIEAVIKQVEILETRANRLQVTLGTNFKGPSVNTFNADKATAKEKDGPWHQGQPYGSNLLAVGREAGNMIIDSLQIDRINFRLNMDEILASCFSKQNTI